MNYDWLFSFVTFADTCNFTQAAKKLGLSQPALHVQIRKLTESIGFPLYLKHGRQLHLTQEGKQVAAYARSIQEQEAGLLSHLQGIQNSPIVLAAGQGAYMYLLNDAIKTFSNSSHPMRLLTLRGPETVDAVLQAKAHLGVAVVSHPPAELISTPIREVGQVAIVHKGHPLALRKTLNLIDLQSHPLIVAPEGSPHRNALQYAMSQAGVVMNVAVEATGWPLVLEFARHKRGVAIVNDFCPPPRGCVAIPLKQMPTALYTLLHRETNSQRVLALRDRILKTSQHSI